jgi:hypothetical protein
VHTSIYNLGIEINSLSQVLSSVNESLGDPSIENAALASQTGHEGQHWRTVARSLKDCERTLQCLHTILEPLSKETGWISVANKETNQIGFQVIANYDTQTTNDLLPPYDAAVFAVDHCVCPPCSMSLTSIRSLLLTNESIAANVSTRLDVLTVEIQHLQARFSCGRPTLGQSNDGDNTRIMTNLFECVRTAGVVISSVSVIVGSRSTEYGASQSGSALEEGLSDAQRMVKEWISHSPIYDDAVRECATVLPESSFGRGLTQHQCIMQRARGMWMVSKP